MIQGRDIMLCLTLVVVGVAVFGSRARPAEVPEVSPRQGIEIELHHFRVSCSGEGLELCYLMKLEGQDEWALYSGEIESFDYEWGYVYRLIVEGTKSVYAVMVGPRVRYRAISTIAKERAPAGEEFDVELHAELFKSAGLPLAKPMELLDGTAVSFSSAILAEQVRTALGADQYVCGRFRHAEDASGIVMLKTIPCPASLPGE